jgi:hypothetical protein
MAFEERKKSDPTVTYYDLSLVNSRNIFGQIFETGEPCLFFSLGELALERAVLLGGLGHLTGLVNSPRIHT